MHTGTYKRHAHIKKQELKKTVYLIFKFGFESREKLFCLLEFYFVEFSQNSDKCRIIYLFYNGYSL